MVISLMNLFLHGLIALVHNRPGDGYVSAYFVDDNAHSTFLAFEMKASSKCDEQSFGYTTCFNDDSLCFCYIDDHVDIKFTPSALPSSVGLRKHRSARPMNKVEARDFSWVVQMSDVDGDAGKAKILDDVSDHVRAVLPFGWQKAEACHLDQVQDEGCTGCDYKIYANQFQTSLSSPSGHTQALAEGVEFGLKFDADDVKLQIKEREGPGMIYLDFGCQAGECPDVLMVNDMDSAGGGGMFDDVGTHFLSYYNLAVGKPKERVPVRLRESSVPLSVGKSQVTCDPLHNLSRIFLVKNKAKPALPMRGKNLTKAEILDLLVNVVITSFETRIICPMALFEN